MNSDVAALAVSLLLWLAGRSIEQSREKRNS